MCGGVYKSADRADLFLSETTMTYILIAMSENIMTQALRTTLNMLTERFSYFSYFLSFLHNK